MNKVIVSITCHGEVVTVCVHLHHLEVLWLASFLEHVVIELEHLFLGELQWNVQSYYHI